MIGNITSPKIYKSATKLSSSKKRKRNIDFKSKTDELNEKIKKGLKAMDKPVLKPPEIGIDEKTWEYELKGHNFKGCMNETYMKCKAESNYNQSKVSLNFLLK